MIDLAEQEEQVARAGEMSVERVLSALEGETAGELLALFNNASDRYLVLAGRGRRTSEQAIEMDRLDSFFRGLLGTNGLLVLAANLLRVLSAAGRGAQAFSSATPDSTQLVEAQLLLGMAADTCFSRLQQTPVPVDGPRLAELTHRASMSAAALLQALGEPGWRRRFFSQRRLADRCTSALLGRLAGREAAAPVWRAAATLLNPAENPPEEQLERVQLCHRLAGLSGCIEILRAVGQTLRDVAKLVSADLAAGPSKEVPAPARGRSSRC